MSKNRWILLGSILILGALILLILASRGTLLPGAPQTEIAGSREGEPPEFAEARENMVQNQIETGG
jgi:hypothetical protein